MDFTFTPNEPLAVPDVVQRRLYQGVFDIFGVNQTQLQSQDRTRTPSLARQAVVLALRHWDRTITFQQLAAAMYRTDHTTARYALEHGQEEYDKVPTFASRVDVLMARVGIRGATEAPHENTTEELIYLRTENERLRSLVAAQAEILAKIQLDSSFANIQLLPAMLRAQEVGGQ